MRITVGSGCTCANRRSADAGLRVGPASRAEPWALGVALGSRDLPGGETNRADRARLTESVSGPHAEGGLSVSIVRVGLAETKHFAEGYDAIFGNKKKASKARKTKAAAGGTAKSKIKKGKKK